MHRIAALLVPALLELGHGQPATNVQIMVENGDATPVVEAQSTVGPPAPTPGAPGVPGHTTYRLSLKLAKDAQNVYTIFGREGSPMIFPPAFQVAPPFGRNIGGVDPQFFNMPGPAQYAQYDSWLTVGMTKAENHGALHVFGADIKDWSEAKGLSTTDGAVFWMNPSDGPSVNDADGKAGTGTSIGSIVVAQLTVKTGVPYNISLNCQGRTASGANWESINLKFHVGPVHSGGVTPHGSRCRDGPLAMFAAAANRACCDRPGLPPTCHGFYCSVACVQALATLENHCLDLLQHSAAYAPMQNALAAASQQCAGLAAGGGH